MSEKARQTKSAGDLVPLEEERAVIQRLQAGDRSAFATLYGWYGELVYRQAILPKLPVRDLAEDCLRDTFRTALEGLLGLIDPRYRDFRRDSLLQLGVPVFGIDYMGEILDG